MSIEKAKSLYGRKQRARRSEASNSNTTTFKQTVTILWRLKHLGKQSRWPWKQKQQGSPGARTFSKVPRKKMGRYFCGSVEKILETRATLTLYVFLLSITVWVRETRSSYCILTFEWYWPHHYFLIRTGIASYHFLAVTGMPFTSKEGSNQKLQCHLLLSAILLLCTQQSGEEHI